MRNILRNFSLFCLVIILFSVSSSSIAEDQYTVSYCILQYDSSDKEVNIPNIIDNHTVVSIGERSFAGNTSIYSISLPLSVKEIGSYAFTQTALESIKFHSPYLTSIGEGAFSSSTSIREIILPERVDFLGNAVFMSCYNLEKIQLPQNMYYIPSYMFFDCYNLEGIELPQSIETIGTYAFYGCSKLQYLFFPENLYMIHESSFENSGLIKAELPCQIQFIHARAFANCDSLEYCFLPPSLLYIDKSAFDGCSPNLSLGVISGSYGHLFAIENSIPYQIINEN